MTTKPDLETHREFNNATCYTYESVENIILKQREPTELLDLNTFPTLKCVRPCTSTYVEQMVIGDLEHLKLFVKDNWLGPIYHREFGVTSNFAMINYVWSRDCNNLLSIEEFIKLEMFYNPSSFLEANIPYILKLDIAAKIYPFLIDNLYNGLDYSYEIYEMFILEKLVPRNISNFSFLKERVNEDVMQTRSKERFLLAFKHLFPDYDPLLSVLVLGKKVQYFREILNEKYNELVFYKVGERNQTGDFDFRNINYSFDNEKWYSTRYSGIEIFCGFHLPKNGRLLEECIKSISAIKVAD